MLPKEQWSCRKVVCVCVSVRKREKAGEKDLARKQMVELLNAQISLGSSRVHIVDSSLVITAV